VCRLFLTFFCLFVYATSHGTKSGKFDPEAAGVALWPIVRFDELMASPETLMGGFFSDDSDGRGEHGGIRRQATSDKVSILRNCDNSYWTADVRTKSSVLLVANADVESGRWGFRVRARCKDPGAASDAVIYAGWMSGIPGDTQGTVIDTGTGFDGAWGGDRGGRDRRGASVDDDGGGESLTADEGNYTAYSDFGDEYEDLYSDDVGAGFGALDKIRAQSGVRRRQPPGAPASAPPGLRVNPGAHERKRGGGSGGGDRKADDDTLGPWTSVMIEIGFGGEQRVSALPPRKGDGAIGKRGADDHFEKSAPRSRFPFVNIVLPEKGPSSAAHFEIDLDAGAVTYAADGPSFAPIGAHKNPAIWESDASTLTTTLRGGLKYLLVSRLVVVQAEIIVLYALWSVFTNASEQRGFVAFGQSAFMALVAVVLQRLEFATAAPPELHVVAAAIRDLERSQARGAPAGGSAAPATRGAWSLMRLAKVALAAIFVGTAAFMAVLAAASIVARVAG
jgi:hypothetical protein